MVAMLYIGIPNKEYSSIIEIKSEPIFLENLDRLMIPNGFKTASMKFTIQNRQKHAHQTLKGEYIKIPVSPSHILYLFL